jgi:signal transduction histidine kinase
VVGVAYVCAVLVLGVLPALVFDPQAQACTPCPSNLLDVWDRGALWTDLNRIGLYLGIGWALALAALVVAKLVRASVWARPVLAAGAVYLGLVAAWFASSLDRGVLSNDTPERRLWLGQAAALLVLAGGVAWTWVRSRRARSAVARFVVNLAESPPPGGLRDVLAATVGDPDLVLSYPVGSTGRLMDAKGRPVELHDGREQTSLVRDGQVAAVLIHARGLLDDQQLADEVAAAARLALVNERLQAEVRARLEELRASRTRIVETGDAERKRLERDLHDGAQQRLVGLSLSLRLARSRLGTSGDPEAVALLEEADAELYGAIAELRELAHGIFPAVLADEGLAAAVEALAEGGRVPFEIRALPERRFAPQLETAAYMVIADAAHGTTKGVAVEAKRSGDTLCIDVELLDEGRLDVVALQDRLGALDGRLAVERRRDGGITIRAELPCGS